MTDLICFVCNKDLTVEVTTPLQRPHTRITRRICGCGCKVTVTLLVDLNRFCSGDPLPGYDRKSIFDRYSGGFNAN